MKRINFKKTSAILLTACMITPISNINLVPAETLIPNITDDMPFHDESVTVKVDGINYVITSEPTSVYNGTVVVSNNSDIFVNDVVIPDTINAYGNVYNVTGIEKNAFSGNKSILSIKIGANVEEIDTYAFINCPKLEKFAVDSNNVKFRVQDGVLFSYNMKKLILYPSQKNVESYIVPSSVTEISDSAFNNNQYLYTLTLSNYLERIGNYAFINCSNLKSVSMNNHVTSIGDYAFAQTSLTTMKLSNSLSNLGKGAFINTNLTSVTIPTRVTEIKNSTFYGCNNLKTVNLSANLELIEEYAFWGTNISEITFPTELREIKYKAFANCKNLEKIKFNDKLRTIGDNVFFECENLRTVSLPRMLSSLGKDVFTGCTRLADISVQSNNEYYEVYDNVLYNKGMSKLIHYPSAKIESSFTIPYSVTEIAENAFSYCTYLNSFEVENTNIHFDTVNGVLFNSDKTKLIQYPIGKGGANYSIPEHVTSISSRAFAGSLISGTLSIPMELSEIGDFAFENCNNISSFSVSENNKYFTTENGILLNKDKTILLQYPIAKSGSSYKMPDSVMTISDGAFLNSSLNKLELGKNVENIGNSAFAFTNMVNFTIPESVQSIGEYAFNGSKVVTLDIIGNPSKIGSYAFANCTNLRSVKFNAFNPPKELGNNLFFNCTQLSKIDVPDGAEENYKRAILNLDSKDKLII